MKLHITVRGIVFSALFAALLSVLSLVNIRLGFSPVPISLENLVTMLAGAFLGAGYGFFSMLLVLVVTALGIPFLHGVGGLAVLFGSTGGYLWAYPIAAFLIGLLVNRIKGNGFGAYILVFLTLEVFGSLLLYVIGVPWLAHVHGWSLSKAMVAGCYPFLLGDAVKAVIGTLIVLPVRQVYPVSRLVGGNHSQVASLE